MRETLGAGKQEDREEEENDPSRAGTSTLVRQGTVAPYTVHSVAYGAVLQSRLRLHQKKKKKNIGIGIGKLPVLNFLLNIYHVLMA